MDEFEGKYDYVSDFVYDGDSKLEIMDDIQEYAFGHSWYHLDFLEDLKQDLNSYGRLTERQYNALVDSYHRFKMEIYLNRWRL